MPTKLILIRHGITDWNREKRYSGSSDIGLSSQGVRQAGKLGRRLKRESVDKVYSSDRKRAVQSAKIIFKNTKIELSPELKEINFGAFEGLTHKEAMLRYPVVYRKWLKDPSSITIPDAEGLSNFRKRVLKAIKKILCLNKDKTVAVVCHGGPISIFINHLLRDGDFWRHIPHPASISVVECNNGKTKLKTFNDTSHLNG